MLNTSFNFHGSPVSRGACAGHQLDSLRDKVQEGAAQRRKVQLRAEILTEVSLNFVTSRTHTPLPTVALLVGNSTGSE